MNRVQKRKLQKDVILYWSISWPPPNLTLITYQGEHEDGEKDKYNFTISLAIGEVIRYSTDDQFRSQCFQLMKVDNTNDFQNAIKDRLELLTNPDFNQINIPARQILNISNSVDKKKLYLRSMPEFSGASSMVTLGSIVEQVDKDKMNEFNLSDNDTNWK